MTGIILHHYAISVFSERVRLALGLKGLTYHSVDIPSMMPKPDLLPLTGGYRRTPVMQIGADIYCDTLLILRKIDDLHPTPSLYPDNTRGLATAMAWWADKSLFWPCLGILADTIGHRIPEAFVTERKAFGFPLDPADVHPLITRHLQQGSAQLAWLAAMLADGRPYMLGDAVSVADLAAYSCFWLLKEQGGEETLARVPFEFARDWAARIAALGHGTPIAMTARDALSVARQSTPATLPTQSEPDPSGLRVGAMVTVTPDDTGRDPVSGELLFAGADELIIRSEHPRAGMVHIHFPRAGFDAVMS